ncbi:cupin domain-containing protein [Corynebacterium breve]|uniref:Cupin domain-containing protein n=2 Tax=Corynebacterium breve TaxID=3049799 RepID=A0ABY8VLB3_9CORY|nr:cupin domain-containing protein [Corynebacterium breve]WIM69018.1 cupin domain-containing protein [Corynebacterium breve]
MSSTSEPARVDGPFTTNIEDATLENENFRTELWTGEFLQVTLMEIPVGGDIGLELHDDTDQFIRLEQGNARVEMGPTKDEVTFTKDIAAEDVVLVPRGEWHNVINTGEVPLKIYTIYAPPHHPKGTVHETQADALADEH